jgi:hypothetical protein
VGTGFAADAAVRSRDTASSMHRSVAGGGDLDPMRDIILTRMDIEF